MRNLTISAAAFVASLACLPSIPLGAQEPTVTPLLMKDLTDMPGKQLLVLTVTYAPGGADSIHRHNADALVYVLEGAVVEQVKGGNRVTLTAGQTFFEGPADVHTVGRNASETQPARILAVLVKDRGTPPVIPVKQMRSGSHSHR